MSANWLADIVRHESANPGAVSFGRFMELALYHPEFGYYEQETTRMGRTGDYYTSVSVGSLFGELLAMQFAQWRGVSSTGSFQIVEAGAHDGRLAVDILTAWQACLPGSFAGVEYWILEPSSRRQNWQQDSLRNFAGRVRWFESWESVPLSGVNGVIFANELLDAFPVHRLGWDASNRRWFEWGVRVEQERFVWTRMPLETEAGIRERGSANQPPETGSQQESEHSESPIPDPYSLSRPSISHRSTTRPRPSPIAAHLTPPSIPEGLAAVLPDGFTIDLCPLAPSWWGRAAAALRQGRLVTFDYGLSEDQLFTPERSLGTARAYYRHHVGTDLLAHPGEQDLTAHVNFTRLQQTGEAAGLKTDAWIPQAQFLTPIIERIWAAPNPHLPPTPARIRQFHTLTHPEHLGRALSVLVQTRWRI